MSQMIPHTSLILESGFFGTAAAETRDVWGSEMLYHKSGSPTHLQLVNPTTLSLVGTVYITFIPFT